MTAAGECSHCGLRLSRRALEATVAGEPGRFCCGGCLLAAHVTRARGDAAVASALVVRVGLAAFFAMNVMMVSLPTWARHVYGGAADGPLFLVLRVLAGILAVPVLVLLGGPLVRGAWSGIVRGEANAEVLVALGVGAAYVLSLANLLTGRPDVYFDTAVTLLVVVAVGRALEALAKVRAGAALRAVAAGPERAMRVRGSQREEVAPEDLVPGELVEVSPGGAFPTDGVVVAGEAEVDESALTGESRPVPKGVGSEVAGGTVSLDGRLHVRVERVAGESALARIREMLDAARAEPARIERIADRFAARLVPAVLLLAAVTGFWWAERAGLDRGILVAVSVLVVACPCGLALATPLAVRSSLLAAARHGIVVRSAPLLERAAEIRSVLFDKTGTLTEPVPAVESIEVVSGDASVEEMLARAAAIEEGIPHPFARALVREAKRRGLVLPRASDVRVRAGRGVVGRIEHALVTVGRSTLVFDALGVVARDPARGVVIASSDGDVARVALCESPVPEAASTVEELRDLGVDVGLASGDGAASPAVAGLFRNAEARFGLAPGDKLARVAEARSKVGRAAVAMIGDGINDAPALAAADLGFAVAGATDLARLSADVVILGGGLRSVPWLLRRARRTRRIVRQNLFWTAAYNAAAVGLAVAGALDPITASLAMLGSSLLVVLNSRRLADDGEPREAAVSSVAPSSTAVGAWEPSEARL